MSIALQANSICSSRGGGRLFEPDVHYPADATPQLFSHSCDHTTLRGAPGNTRTGIATNELRIDVLRIREAVANIFDAWRPVRNVRYTLLFRHTRRHVESETRTPSC